MRGRDQGRGWDRVGVERREDYRDAGTRTSYFFDISMGDGCTDLRALLVYYLDLVHSTMYIVHTRTS